MRKDPDNWLSLKDQRDVGLFLLAGCSLIAVPIAVTALAVFAVLNAVLDSAF